MAKFLVQSSSTLSFSTLFYFLARNFPKGQLITVRIASRISATAHRGISSHTGRSDAAKSLGARSLATVSLAATLTVSAAVTAVPAAAAPAQAAGSAEALAGSSLVHKAVGQPNPDYYRALDLSSGMPAVDHLAAFNILFWRLLMYPIGFILGTLDSASSRAQ